MNYIQHGSVLLSEFKEEASRVCLPRDVRVKNPSLLVLPVNSFETHKKDLARWSQLNTLDKNEQAPLVVHMLDGDPSGIKEKFDENVQHEDLGSEEGVTKLIEFLKSIYDKDSLSDGFKKYIFYSKFSRSSGKSIQDFLQEWTTA